MFIACDKDEECDFDIAGTYTFQSSSCQFLDVPQTLVISAGQTEFTFENSVVEYNDCEFNTVTEFRERNITFDEDGFDFEGRFDDDNNVEVTCEGRYTKS
jgi:hypothetical protein